MPAPKELDPTGGPRAQFGYELRKLRQDANWSQDELAAKLRFSTSLVGAIERGDRVPAKDFVEQAEAVFGLQGELMTLWSHLSKEASPRWFRPWLEIEAEAENLRAWEPLVLPGLLQTEEYARAVIRGKPGATREQIDEALAARMRRQKLFHGPKAPMYWAVIDEGVLRRPIGGAEVMRRQMEHLLTVLESPRVSLQVVPLELGSTTGLLGGFAIAQHRGLPDTAYLESAGSGHVTDRPEEVRDISLRYEAIRADAHSQHVSARLIREMMVTAWTT